MSIYHHLLVAIDFSEADPTIIARARTLACTPEVPISLVHVLDNIAMPDTAYGTRINLDEASDYALLETEKNHFRHVADSVGIAYDRCWLIWGPPQQEIVRLAQQQSIDLIVLGFHSQSGLRVLLGSTANGVLHHAPCDLLAIHL